MVLPRIFFLLSLSASVINAQNLGDPSLLSSYPACAQECATEILPRSNCSSTDIVCQCSPPYRAATAACEEVSCTPSEYSKTQTLAAQLCGIVYSNGTVNPSSVSAAIATSTAAAAAAVASKDVTNPASYPPCAQACMSQYLPLSGCGSLANRKCACQTSNLNANLGSCETKTCSKDDLLTITYLAVELCNPVGGVGNTSAVVNQTIATQTAPTPANFTGGAEVLGTKGMMAVLGLAMAVALFAV